MRKRGASSFVGRKFMVCFHFPGGCRINSFGIVTIDGIELVARKMLLTIGVPTIAGVGSVVGHVLW